jgi:hypothetical protein
VSRLAEKTLLRWLPYDDAMAMLVREGLSLDIVPTKEYHPLVQWCLDYYGRSGQGPNAAVIVEEFGDLLADHEIELSDRPEDEPEESAEYVIDTLKEDYVRLVAQRLSIKIAEQMAAAPRGQRVEVFTAVATEMIGVAQSMQPRTSVVDARESMVGMLARYDQIAASGNPVRGMTLGLPEVDERLLGIWPGELCTLCAPPKMGKSYFANFVALNEWKRGRAVCVYTLENSIEMTELRLACIATGLSIEELQTGRLSAEDYDRLKTWVHDEMRASDVPLRIACPDDDLRTPQAIVAQARSFDADSLIVDQLSHLEVGRTRSNWSRTNELAHIIKGLKTAISTGRNPLSCMLIHQINRAGEEALEKTNRLEKRHAADSSEVERSAEPLLGLYASQDEQACGLANLQVLAARRVPPGLGWLLDWNVDVGRISVRGPLAEAA